MNPYIGEVRLFAGNFAPVDWAFCDGSLLPIANYDALFNLIGTTYGGDGQTTFALPDLRGRLPLHAGSGFVLGSLGGVDNVTLNTQQIPSHTHPLQVSQTNGNQTTTTGNLLAGSDSVGLYNSNAPSSLLSASAVGSAGSSQAHENFQPYLCVNFMICLFGIFPSQN
jgi:microcystin-dependent protein